MHFVKALLAIEHVTSKFDEARAFRLEEMIGGDEGHFRKYLNNVSAAPVSFTNKDDKERAEFLAFSQHVQYFKMKKKWHLLLIIKVSLIFENGSLHISLCCFYY